MERWVRIAKVVALLGFLLPWATVSCQNQVISSPSGLNLMLGSITMTNPMTGASETHRTAANVWAVLGFLVIAAGLLLAFLKSGREMARFTIITSAVGMLLCWLATRRISMEALMEEASQQRTGGRDAEMMAALIRIEFGLGFWVVLAALAAAAFAAFRLLGGDVAVVTGTRTNGSTADPGD